MGVRWGGVGHERRRSTDLWNAGAAGALIGGLLIGALLWATDDDPTPARQPLAAEIDAAVIVDATVIELHGYGPDGEPGVFLYDCERNNQQSNEPGDPTLVCTQREDGEDG